MPTLEFLNGTNPTGLLLKWREIVHLSEDTFISKPELFDLFFPLQEDLSSNEKLWSNIRSSVEAKKAITAGYYKLANCCGFSVDHHGFVFETSGNLHRFLSWANIESHLDVLLQNAVIALHLGSIHGHSTTGSVPQDSYPYAPPLREFVARELRLHRSSSAAAKWLTGLAQRAPLYGAAA